MQLQNQPSLLLRLLNHHSNQKKRDISHQVEQLKRQNAPGVHFGRESQIGADFDLHFNEQGHVDDQDQCLKCCEHFEVVLIIL